ncbi:MAG TPA: zinc ribbon domain-containing protein [Acidimicrobiales bacterium]|nr:zinc ribbon domain-containing protein [Acidimicrobiales bacterium]
MTCPRCSTANPPASRFCHRCGEPLGSSRARAAHYAAHPAEPVRALALVSTLFPHVSGHRHAAYRAALALALVATIVAGAFGALAVALVCAAIALPTVVLLYQHDHDVWIDVRPALLGAVFLAALGLGIGTGILAVHWGTPSLLTSISHDLPPAGTVLELGVALPAIAAAILGVLTLGLLRRPAFAHAVDAVNFGAVVGTAFSLGESVAIQHGAFQSIGLSATNPAQDTLVAITLGLAKPVLYAAGTALIALGLLGRRGASRRLWASITGLALIVLFDLEVVLLAPYGGRGVTLSFLLTAVLAAAGLVAVRDAVHGALVDEAIDAVRQGRGTLVRSAAGDVCENCGMPLLDGAAFCVACGVSVATLPKGALRWSAAPALAEDR